MVDSSVYRHDETQQGDFMIREMSNKRVALNNKRTAARLAAEPENAEKIRCAIREGHKGIVCIAKAAGLTYMVARFIAHKYGIEIPTRDGHPLREPGVTCAGKSKVQRAEMLEGA